VKGGVVGRFVGDDPGPCRTASISYLRHSLTTLGGCCSRECLPSLDEYQTAYAHERPSLSVSTRRQRAELPRFLRAWSLRTLLETIACELVEHQAHQTTTGLRLLVNVQLPKAPCRHRAVADGVEMMVMHLVWMSRFRALACSSHHARKSGTPWRGHSTSWP